MSCNLGTLIAGPAIVRYKGQTFYSKGDITLSPSIETFAIEVSAFGGSIEERESNAPFTASFIPAGEFEALPVLYPFMRPKIGASIIPVVDIVAVETTDNELTVPDHRIRTGSPVRFATAGGTLPAGLDATTVFYARAVDADTVTVHASQADALAGDDPVDITTAGAGRNRIVEQEPLVVWAIDGRRITFHVAAVTQQPDFIGSAIQTVFGQVTFEFFRKLGTPATTADSLYTVDYAAYPGDATFDPANILTQPYSAAWGGVGNWAAFGTKAGFTCSFPAELAPIEDDACGIIGRKLTGAGATCTAQPTNADELALLDSLKLQGAGAGRGRRLIGDNLNITGTGVYVRLYAASARTAPQVFGTTADRAGDMQWTAARTFTAGAINPLFHIGTAAPV